MTTMDTDIETTTTTTTIQFPEYEEDGNHQRASTMQVNFTQGRMSVAVTGMDPTPKEGGEGRWQEARRRMRRRATGEETAGGKSVPSSAVPAPAATPAKNQARFAKQVAARLTKAARMPRELPKGDYRVILRPRGGLNVARTAAPLLMEAILEVAGITLQESREDAICTNDAQNIIVISTPHEQRAQKYSSISSLKIAGRVHEVCAYVPAPEGTVKGVIRNIPTAYTEQELQEIIVSGENPTALEAHRIGSTTTVIVAFEGTTVPSTIKFGALITKCSLYKQHYEVCHCCGRLGHRTDVCPYPNTKVCFACGAPNPGPAHELECKPRCKLCGGAHPTGAAGCKNRYKTPHLVKQRRWERRRAEEQRQQQRRVPTLGLADFPQLQRAPEKVTTTATDGSAPAERSTGSAGNHGKSSSSGQLREGVAWAKAVVAPPLPLPPQPKAQQQQPTAETIELRGEVARLKEQLAQRDRQIQELSTKLDMVLNNQLHQQQRQQPPLQALPQVARRQAQRRAYAQEEQMQLQEESEPECAAGLRTAESTEEEEEGEGEVIAATSGSGELTTTAEGEEAENFSPRAKRRVTMLEALERRHQRLDERVDHTERELEAINQRIAKVEATTADMNTRMANVERLLQQLLTRIPDLTHQQQQQSQLPQQPQPQPPQQQPPQQHQQTTEATRPTWPEQR